MRINKVPDRRVLTIPIALRQLHNSIIIVDNRPCLNHPPAEIKFTRQEINGVAREMNDVIEKMTWEHAVNSKSYTEMSAVCQEMSGVTTEMSSVYV